MKKIFLLTTLCVFILLCCGCSSENNEDAPIVKDKYNVELSDILGTWMVYESTQSNLKGIKLILDDHHTCTWIDSKGNYFVGPYYFLTNVKDNILLDIGKKLNVESLGDIHISQIKVVNYISDKPSTLSLTCDLKPFLADPNWSDFANKVNHEEWSFWTSSTFNYDFEIIGYSANKLELSLKESTIRYDSYPEKYPLRIPDNTKLTLVR